MPALEGQFLKEISVRFAGENHLRTQKNTKRTLFSASRKINSNAGEGQSIAQKGVRANEARNPEQERAKVLQKNPVSALLYGAEFYTPPPPHP